MRISTSSGTPVDVIDREVLNLGSQIARLSTEFHDALVAYLAAIDDGRIDDHERFKLRSKCIALSEAAESLTKTLQFASAAA